MLARVAFVVLALGGALSAQTLLVARFDKSSDGFAYRDDTFRGTRQPGYASGARIASGGFRGGALRVALGGIDGATIRGMSGGFARDFTVGNLGPGQGVELSFRFKLTQTPHYERDEFSQALASVDGTLRGQPPYDWAATVVGNGNGGTAVTSHWKLLRVHLGRLGRGSHRLVIGGYNSKKSLSNESTEVLIDDVVVRVAPPPDHSAGVRAVLGFTSLARYKENVRKLSGFGDRRQGSASYAAAEKWLIGELQAAGYEVEHHAYTFRSQPRRSTYVTKVGTVFPDRVFIVSAHFDGRGGGGAADDDGSGSSLVLEAARAFAQPGIHTEVSVRFVFWNNEETGLQGSSAYVRDRAPLQGIESPPGSGKYPEPTWLGMIQHDMMMFDHGLPPQRKQIPGADTDVEYRSSATNSTSALGLARALQAGNKRHALRYPVEIGSRMSSTDSMPFRNVCPAVSSRENRRLAEIGRGSNPHWHRATDVFATYSDADFRLGFDALRTTLGTVAELAGASDRRATFATFGSGCKGSAGTPRLAAANSLPWIGQSFDMTLSSLPKNPSNAAFGMLGLSRTEWQGFTLPLDLAFLGMPRCTLFVSVDASATLQSRAGTATWRLPIPADRALVDAVFFVQGLAADPGANAAGLVVSNAGQARIGLR